MIFISYKEAETDLENQHFVMLIKQKIATLLGIEANAKAIQEGLEQTNPSLMIADDEFDIYISSGAMSSLFAPIHTHLLEE